jgi:hypothetical protein
VDQLVRALAPPAPARLGKGDGIGTLSGGEIIGDRGPGRPGRPGHLCPAYKPTQVSTRASISAGGTSMGRRSHRMSRTTGYTRGIRISVAYPLAPAQGRKVELGLACRSQSVLWKCMGYGLIRSWVRGRLFHSLFRSMLNNRWGNNGQAHFGG